MLMLRNVRSGVEKRWEFNGSAGRMVGCVAIVTSRKFAKSEVHNLVTADAANLECPAQSIHECIVLVSTAHAYA